MTIISTTKSPSGVHAVEGHSWLTDPSQVPEGFVPVPETLEGKVMESLGYCDLVLDADGNLIDITPTERPAPEPPPSDPQADTDALLVDLSYRVALIELG